MDETDNANLNDSAGQKPDPADALANMAANQPTEITPPDAVEDGDPTDALADLADDTPPPPTDEDFVPAPPAAEGEQFDAEMAEATGLAGEDAFRARQARQATIGSHANAAQQHAFRRTAIPLLIVMGVLLLLVGLASAGILISNKAGGARGSHDGVLLAIMIVSFPLAAVMAYGAWQFTRDVKARR